MRKEDYIDYLKRNVAELKESVNGAIKVFRLDLPEGWEDLTVEDLKAGYKYVKGIMANEYAQFAKIQKEMPPKYWERHDKFDFCSDTEEHKKRNALIKQLRLVINSNKRPDMFKKQYVRSKSAKQSTDNKKKRTESQDAGTGESVDQNNANCYGSRSSNC